MTKQNTKTQWTHQKSQHQRVGAWGSGEAEGSNTEDGCEARWWPGLMEDDISGLEKSRFENQVNFESGWGWEKCAGLWAESGGFTVEDGLAMRFWEEGNKKEKSK